MAADSASARRTAAKTGQGSCSVDDLLGAVQADRVLVLESEHTEHSIRHVDGNVPEGGWHVWLENRSGGYCDDWWTDRHASRSLLERAQQRDDRVFLESYQDGWPPAGRSDWGGR